MRSTDASDAVVCRLDVRNPVTNGLRCRIFERRCSCIDRNDLRTTELHSEDIKLLAFYILSHHTHFSLFVDTEMAFSITLDPI